MEQRWFRIGCRIGAWKIWSSICGTWEEDALHGCDESAIQVGDCERSLWTTNFSRNRNSISLTVRINPFSYNFFFFCHICHVNLHWIKSHPICYELIFDCLYQSSEYIAFVHVFLWWKTSLFGTWAGNRRRIVSSSTNGTKWTFSRGSCWSLYISSRWCTSLLSSK